MKEFKTMSRVEKASREELILLVGENRSNLIQNYFQQKRDV
jgi:hypothetical protein